MFNGILSHKLRNFTHLGGSIDYYIRFIPVQMFGSPMPPSPFSVWTAHQYMIGHIFHRLWALFFRVGQWCLHSLLFVLVVYTLCGALALQTIELRRSLGDAAVWDRTFGSKIRFFQMVCYCNFTVLKSH